MSKRQTKLIKKTLYFKSKKEGDKIKSSNSKDRYKNPKIKKHKCFYTIKKKKKREKSNISDYFSKKLCKNKNKLKNSSNKKKDNSKKLNLNNSKIFKSVTINKDKNNFKN